MQTAASIAASSPQRNASPGVSASGAPVNMAALMGGISSANANAGSVDSGVQQAGPPQGVNAAVYAQLLQIYPQISTMPPQVVQQMVLQFQVRMAAAAAANNNGQMISVPNTGIPANGQSGQSTNNNLNLNLMMNMLNNPNMAAIGANAGVATSAANFQNSANGLGGNHAALAALMASNPNLAANMKMMQIFRQQQHLLSLQNANNMAGLSGGVSTGGTAVPSAGVLPPNMNPAMAAYFGRNAMNGATPQTMQLFNNARNTAALAANSNSGVPDAPTTPVPVNAGSPANNGTDGTATGGINGQQAQIPTPQQPQPNQGAQAIANMSAQEISIHRNTLFTRIQAVVAAINRPGITEMEKLTLLLNRLTMQMQMAQLDHFFKLKSGIVIQPAEAEATKNAVQQLKLNIANVRARINMQQSIGQPQPGLTAQMPQMGTDSNTVMIPNTPAPVSLADPSPNINFSANNAVAQVSNSIAQYTQQSAVGAATAINNMRPALVNQQSAQNMIQSVSPQQSRPLFGGTEAYLGGTATGPASTLQGFLAKSIHELPQASMEERLRALIDDSSTPGIDSDRGNGAKRKLCDLLAEIDASDSLDPGVEDVLYTLADNFIDHVTQVACKMAKHRHSRVAKIKDFQFPLAGSNTPGLHASALASTGIHPEHNPTSISTIRPPPKRFPTPNHISRSIQVKKALRDDQIHLVRQRTLEAQRLREAAGGADGDNKEDEEPDSDVEAEGEEEEGVGVGGADEEGYQRKLENPSGSDEVDLEGEAAIQIVKNSVIGGDQANCV
ncbi:hypothetical protein HDU77_010308 [Chytriomyces hyalinus]|nr:hypothetical protein HDU77_010308 [Chytriomyces hyalinus]